MSNRYDRSKSVWVIVRVDLFQLRAGAVPNDPQVFVAVKEVVDTEEQAMAEVERLTDIQAGKDVVYFYEQGRSPRHQASASEEHSSVPTSVEAQDRFLDLLTATACEAAVDANTSEPSLL